MAQLEFSSLCNLWVLCVNGLFLNAKIAEIRRGPQRREEYEFGLAELTFLDEIVATRIIFGPDDAEPLLGVVALESAGFLVDPNSQTLRKRQAFPLKMAVSAK